MTSALSLHQRLNLPGPLMKLAGAHNVMGARLAGAAGFGGVWASSLEIATAAVALCAIGTTLTLIARRRPRPHEH